MSSARNEAQQAVVGTNSKKKWYLLISNPSKTTHLGTLLRCAAAFQCHQVLLVGYDKFNCQGSFGSHLFLDIVVFPSWDSVHDYLRRGGDDGENDTANDEDSKCNANENYGKNADNGERQNSNSKEQNQSSPPHNPINIIGILGAYGGGEEIFSPDGIAVHEDEDSYASLVPPKGSANTNNLHLKQDTATCLPQRSFPTHTRPFSTDVCFLLSKYKRGIPMSQARMCSGFVHVPHLSFDNDGSPTVPITQSSLLDTATTLSTVLHHFTAWAGYEERTFAENQKFVKDVIFKPNARRRICRVIGKSNEKKDKREHDKNPESNPETEAMDAMMLWKETEGTSQGSDY